VHYFDYERKPSMLYSEVYAKRIQSLCAQHGITINRLAVMSGLKQSTIDNIIHGRSRNPKARTLPTNPIQTRIHPRPPAGSPRAILFPLFFPLFMRVSEGFGLRVRVSCKAPDNKKSPMPWGFHSTRLLWFAMLFWASEMAEVTLN